MDKNSAVNSPLITVEELAKELAGDRPPVLLDIRWQLTAPSAGSGTAGSGGQGGAVGAAEYAAGHLPGAVFVDLDRVLAAPPGAGGRHPLPDPVSLGAALRLAGVSADRPVVVYDGGPATSAARAWWVLRWAGHPAVRVLDGGFAAWRAAGQPESTEAPAPAAGDFTPTPGQLPTLDADQAAELARTGLLLDARAGERYRGEVEPLDPQAGHIPGAVSAPTFENNAADGRFRSAAELVERFRALGVEGQQVGVYCGSGVTAAHQALALAVAGHQVALYPGSWSEWSNDPRRPVATGADRG
ncbi:sulfurtransferase [Kitasatospora kifunensis]|uniref:Sulfurtransferase n=1 Tax=Kitasatospora kifunensis TaxID=58351 RepID=A0A7W7R5B0_KITKI|nr:sulfurtransferase [Kitasatospora kifunensis]MBB4925690.1 thiosulfate/3-mercaptopyruvate sulfurtransferase [Kitasatospora kifunensis]